MAVLLGLRDTDADAASSAFSVFAAKKRPSPYEKLLAIVHLRRVHGFAIALGQAPPCRSFSHFGTLWTSSK